MPARFGRTSHALKADRLARSVAGLLPASLLFAAWLAWFFLARVSLYEVTESARVENGRTGYSVQSPVEGRLISTNLALGREVLEGDELARVESDTQTLQRREQEARLAALRPQIQPLEAEIAANEQAGRDERQALNAQLEVMRAQVRQAEAPAKFAQEDVGRLQILNKEGLVAEREVAQGESDAQSRRAAVDSLRLAMARAEREQTTRDAERQTRLQRLRGEIARMQGDIDSTAAMLARLQLEIERRVIRAPVAGELADVPAIRPGAIVKEGDRLAAIVPSGKLRLVAEYAPASAFGRIRPGQEGHLRLQGFPWMQYGSLPVRVERVAGEVRNGTVRVEMSVDASSSTIPLQHGLPGSVEVEVERVSPAVLTLRLAGRISAAPRPNQGPVNQSPANQASQ